MPYNVKRFLLAITMPVWIIPHVCWMLADDFLQH